MTAPATSASAPAANADVADTLRLLLARGASPVTVRSPPGAGKTGLVAMAAAESTHAGERVSVVTATNNQAGELCSRIARTAPRAPVVMLLGYTAQIPDTASAAVEDGLLAVARRFDQVPAGPVTVVSSNAKWLCHPHAQGRPYDLQILEEAYMQSLHATFPLANLARRHLTVGDPGQTAPFTPVDDRRWRGQPLSPLTPAGTALERLNPDAVVLQLATSLRLPDDTCRILQPLYPDLPFNGLAATGQRSIAALAEPGGPAGEVLRGLEGRSLLAWELPGEASAGLDLGLCRYTGALADALHGSGLLAVDDVRGLPRPATLAVVCARSLQVAAVRSQLSGAARRSVAVDTVNRMQGLEYDIVLGVDPLAGHYRLGAFDLEPGRLCVMLSRHSTGFVFVTRADVARNLRRHVPSSDRMLGLDPDAEFNGWMAHQEVRALLRGR